MALNIRNLKEVRALLYKIRKRWYDIGIELNVDIGELDIIRDKHDDPGECLLEMLKIWLRSISPQPSWKILAKVLRGGILNEVELAEQASSNEQASNPPDPPEAHKSGSSYNAEGGLNFPFLTPEKKVTLITRLERETNNIMRKFGTLLGMVGQSMDKSDTRIQHLKLFFNGCGMQQLAESIDHAESISAVMNRATKEKYWTFFNYELLESMITTLCKAEEPCLNSYKTDFTVYCRRRLVAVPAIISENASPGSDSIQRFNIMLDRNFSISIKDVKNLQQMISELLNVHPLYLIEIRDGSVELTFGCFKKFEEVFPEEKREEITLKLADHKVKVLKFGTHELMIQQKSTDGEIVKQKEDIPQVDALTNVLASKDKEEINAYLLPFKKVWYGLGISLGIPTEKMNQIQELYDDPGDCLQEMIEELLASPEISLTSIEELEVDADHEKEDHPSCPDESEVETVSGIQSDTPEEIKQSAEGASEGFHSIMMQKISKHPCYHGCIDMETAKKRLQKEQKNCHLMRYSENRVAFTLTVYRVIKDEEEEEEEEEIMREVFQNFNILITNSDGNLKWEISGTEMRFTNIAEMLAFYRENPLHPLIEDIGEECTHKTCKGKESEEKQSPKKFPCIIERDGEGVNYVTRETRKKFSLYSEFLAYCESKEVDKRDLVFLGDEQMKKYKTQMSSDSLSDAIPGRIMTAMKHHPSFHGPLRRIDATKKLFARGGTCYLTRYSNFHKTCIISVLSTLTDGELLQHFKLNITDGERGGFKYEVDGTHTSFNDVGELLDHYQSNSIVPQTTGFGECLKVKTVSQHDPPHFGHRQGSTNFTPIQECIEVQAHETKSARKKGKGLEQVQHAKAVPSGKIKLSTLPNFYGVLDLDAAEEHLREQNRECCYLIRYSEAREENILSVCMRKGDDINFYHFYILTKGKNYEILGSGKKFSKLDALLEYYKENPLNHNVKTIGYEIRKDTKPTTSFIIKESEMSESAESNSDSDENLHLYELFMSEEGLDNAVPKWALDVMQNHPSFHGSISKIEAATKLIESGRNCFLTRYSDYHGACIISIFQISSNGEEMLHHLKLDIPKGCKRCKINGTTEEFDDISTLLETYKSKPIKNINGLGECLQSNIWQSSIDQIPEDKLLQEENTSMQEDMTRPTISNLSCIHYEDEGETKAFRLIEDMSDRWRQMGQLLSLKKDTLDKYRNERDSVKRAKQVFAKWIKHNGHRNYPVTWLGLHMLLMKLGRRTVAENLFKVLYLKGTKNSVDTLYLLQ